MGERDNVKTHTHIPSLDSRPHNERNEPIVSHGRGGMEYSIQDSQIKYHMQGGLTMSRERKYSTGSNAVRPPRIPSRIWRILIRGNARYVDAAIVREGPYGDQGDGAYSAGVRPCPYPLYPDCATLSTFFIYTLRILTNDAETIARRSRKHQLPTRPPNIQRPARCRRRPRARDCTGFR